ncbi:hypothetical protein PUW59_04190 [Lactobacillus mulieris]|nr:hypothetical protein PUW59_04190 [Lactobacillus mulieris]
MTKLKCTRLIFEKYDRVVTVEYKHVIDAMSEHKPIVGRSADFRNDNGEYYFADKLKEVAFNPKFVFYAEPIDVLEKLEETKFYQKKLAQLDELQRTIENSKFYKSQNLKFVVRKSISKFDNQLSSLQFFEKDSHEAMFSVNDFLKNGGIIIYNQQKVVTTGLEKSGGGLYILED